MLVVEVVLVHHLAAQAAQVVAVLVVLEQIPLVMELLILVAVAVEGVALALLALAVQESLLFPTHLQLNYSVVELLPNQAVNISIPLLLQVR
jgi:hypothetical protein